ncbi:MAG: hypothetical protein L0216_08240 [Planctomycetales bacterium]|nr:hypothetical protein [Planctomycetales bacterium]
MELVLVLRRWDGNVWLLRRRDAITGEETLRFPSGQVRPWEEDAAAVARIAKETLNVSAVPGAVLCETTSPGEDDSQNRRVYHVTLAEGSSPPDLLRDGVWMASAHLRLVALEPEDEKIARVLNRRDIPAMIVGGAVLGAVGGYVLALSQDSRSPALYAVTMGIFGAVSGLATGALARGLSRLFGGSRRPQGRNPAP